MYLFENVRKLLYGISGMLAETPEKDVFSGMEKEMQEMRKRLDSPLRVAIVGVMKAGKSTLMNALLKEKLLFTSALEATYTVTWFKYGETPKLKVVFRDGSIEEAPITDLEKWTVMPEEGQAHQLDRVKHVEVYYPNEILQKMELIDTPGLESTTDTASGNTRDFLGQKRSEEAARLTTENASEAEAIIYAFSRGASGRDAEVMAAFGEGSRNASPINAIGLFTKADIYWNCAANPGEDPLETIAEACVGYRKQLRDKLYTVLPVTAKCVECVSNIDDDAFSVLQQLAAVEPFVLEDFLSDAVIFSTEPADAEMPVSAEDRKYVLDLFGQYGVYKCVQAVREGIGREELLDYMYQISGVRTAAKVVRRHFGNRAFLIKTEYILNRIRKLTGEIQKTQYDNSRVMRICDRITDDVEQLREREQSFKELEFLQMFYEGELQFPVKELEKEFLQVMGENGSSCERKLGFKGGVPVTILRREAATRSQRWNGVAQHFGFPQNVKQAAEVVVRACDNMYYHLDRLAGFEE